MFSTDEIGHTEPANVCYFSTDTPSPSQGSYIKTLDNSLVFFKNLTEQEASWKLSKIQKQTKPSELGEAEREKFQTFVKKEFLAIDPEEDQSKYHDKDTMVMTKADQEFLDKAMNDPDFLHMYQERQGFWSKEGTYDQHIK